MNERSSTPAYLLARFYPVHLYVRLNHGVVGVHDGRHVEGNTSRLVKLRGVSLYNIEGHQACEPLRPLRVGLVHRRSRKKTKFVSSSKTPSFTRTAFDILYFMCIRSVLFNNSTDLNNMFYGID